MSDREKKVERYTLTFHDSTREVLVSSPLEVLGHVQMAGLGLLSYPLVSSRSGFGVPVHIALAAADFLTECLAEQEREELSKFKCEVEYEFERSAADPAYVAVKRDGNTIAILNKNTNYHAAVPEAVVAAARKFAGWA